jgi:hypothetical protein
MLAMPIAGACAWTVAGFLGAILSETDSATIAMFAIFPTALLVSRFTGEDLLGTNSQNELDTLSVLSLVTAMLGWGIGIPFWLVEPSSLPLSAGIIAGLVWVPMSWILQHWVCLFHAISRTVLVMAAWFAFPDHRFVVIPAIVVIIYVLTIFVIATRQLPRRESPNGG